jgi:hypothetical protein
MNTSESQNSENTSRPFGYWLKAADHLMAAEFATRVRQRARESPRLAPAQHRRRAPSHPTAR